MVIKMNEVEKSIIKKHDPSCRGRALLEMEIVSALCRAAMDAGYYFEVDGEDEEDVTSINDLKRVLFNLDDATLIVKDENQKEVGWVKLVFGNSGYDLVSDYSLNLKNFLKPVNDLADFWGA
jgi:hypothetical protein